MNSPSTPAPCLALLVTLSAALCLSACDRLSERTLSEDQAGKAPASAGERAGPEAGEEGSDCSVDTDCNSYLRCIDNLCSVPPAVTGEHGTSTPKVVIKTSDGREVADFWIELAESDAEQQRGLMFRREMHPDWGMLFVYDGEAQRSFWMENTFIPLDMVFIDASGEVVSIVEDAQPLTRVKRRSRGPARFVLELNAGTSEKLGIEPGMQVEFEDVAADIAPDRPDNDQQ